MIKIVQKEDKILRKVALPVLIKDIKTPKIQKIISAMKQALTAEDDGVAIAAPQIAVPLRIFVVSKKVGPLMNGLDNISAKELDKLPDSVYINPIIKKKSRLINRVDEGCLSVRYLYGKVMRADKALIEAYDETGKKFTRGGSGLLAQIFQHEVDHLDGTLFIDKAEDIIEAKPENLK